MKEVNIEDLDKIKSEYDLMCAYAYGHVYNDFEQYYDRDVLNRCIWFKPAYWAVLMPVWQKLRGELNQTKEMYKLRYDIENAIITCDITTAHQLIYEAIELIKK